VGYFCLYQIKNYIWKRKILSLIHLIALKIKLLVFFLGLSVSLLAQTAEPSKLSIRIDGREVSFNPKSSIELSAGYHEIIFLFPEKYTYKYRLKNLENQWQKTDFPQVRYTNLDGGDYQFYGKILSGNVVLSEFSYQIKIKENFWKKWWFWLFVGLFFALFVGSTLYFWFLYDFRQRMKTEQIRQRIAADLHDEVGANLSSITFLVESLRKRLNGSHENVKDLLERISSNSTESATLINDTIWALNPAYDSFDKLLERIKSFASGLFSANDIAFSIENNLGKYQIELSIEQRRNLYHIIKESINNIIKHAQATKVFLRINEDEKGVKVSIEDNGVGFCTKREYEGNGIKNYKIRTLGDEIKVNVSSEIDVGTKVDVILLMKNH
jgi:signal transduction histidine kinase